MKVVEFFDDFEMMAFLCLIAKNFQYIIGLGGNIQKKYIIYSAQTGDDPS